MTCTRRSPVVVGEAGKLAGKNMGTWIEAEKCRATLLSCIPTESGDSPGTAAKRVWSPNFRIADDAGRIAHRGLPSWNGVHARKSPFTSHFQANLANSVDHGVWTLELNHVAAVFQNHLPSSC